MSEPRPAYKGPGTSPFVVGAAGPGGSVTTYKYAPATLVAKAAKVNLRQQLEAHRDDASPWWGVGGAIFQFTVGGIPGLSWLAELGGLSVGKLAGGSKGSAFNIGRQVGQAAQNMLSTVPAGGPSTEAHELRHMTHIDDVPGPGGGFSVGGGATGGWSPLDELVEAGEELFNVGYYAGYEMTSAGITAGEEAAEAIFGSGGPSEWVVDWWARDYAAYPTDWAIQGMGPPTFENSLRRNVMDFMPGLYLPEPLWWSGPPLATPPVTGPSGDAIDRIIEKTGIGVPGYPVPGF